MNNQELIDLHKSNSQLEEVVEQIKQQLKQPPKFITKDQLRILFQFQGIIPQSYTLQIASLKVECLLLKQQNQIIVTEDFYLTSQEFYQIMIRFIAFLYIGKLKYQTSEYLIYVKLSVYFQCQELFLELLFRINRAGLDRSFFLPVFIYLFNNPIFANLEYQLKNQFIREIILANTNYFQNFKKWNQERIQKVQQAFAVVTPSIFENFALHLRGNDKIEDLTQFLFELNEIKNPNISTLELIYIEKIVDIVDEPFLEKYALILTNNVKSIFEKIVHKDNQIVHHFIQSKICNQHKMYFMSSCGHMTCLNCFLEYFLFKVTMQISIAGQNQKRCSIKCISRYLDDSICDSNYICQDFKHLEKFVPNELLQIYLNK